MAPKKGEQRFNIKSFSKTVIEDFIEAYKNETCLWKSDSVEYSNRNRRDKATRYSTMPIPHVYYYGILKLN